MNLAELMNDLADDVDTQALPEPEHVRGLGDQLRRRHRNRLAAGAAVLAMAAGATAVAVTAGDPRSAPEPAGPVKDWRVVRAVDVPGAGAAIVGDGSLWVVDMDQHGLTDDGSAPSGNLYQLDPESGAILGRIPEGVGGWPAVGGGAVWLMTAAGYLNVLTRVDLTTHEVTRAATTHPRTLPSGVAAVGNTLWVASHETGELILMDTHTLAIRRTISFQDQSASGGSPETVATDGTSVWVSDNKGVLTRYDAATERPITRLQLPARDVRLDGFDAQGLLYAHDEHAIYRVMPGTGAAPDRFRDVLHVTTDPDGGINDLDVTADAIWLATLNPDELLRVDPTSFEVTGSTPLEGLNHKSNAPVDIAATDDAVWVRVAGKVLELTP